MPIYTICLLKRSQMILLVQQSQSHMLYMDINHFIRYNHHYAVLKLHYIIQMTTILPLNIGRYDGTMIDNWKPFFVPFFHCIISEFK